MASTQCWYSANSDYISYDKKENNHHYLKNENLAPSTFKQYIVYVYQHHTFSLYTVIYFCPVLDTWTLLGVTLSIVQHKHAG